MTENPTPETTGAHDHHGQDRGDDPSQGPLSDEQEQRLPLLSQNNAGEIEKVTGILVQTRDDMASEPRERIVQALTERLSQAGIEASDADVQELADQITTGDAGDPQG